MKKISAVEELDYFGCYLDCGLYFDDAQVGEFNDVALDGFTEPIEAYRRYETGRSTVAVEKPRQKLPPEISVILGELRRINSRSALQLSLLLLDMSGVARGQVADAISSLRHKAQVDGKLHDFSTLRKDGHTGFTFMVARHGNVRQLVDRLSAWCQIKMAKTGAKCWGGLCYNESVAANRFPEAVKTRLLLFEYCRAPRAIALLALSRTPPLRHADCNP